MLVLEPSVLFFDDEKEEVKGIVDLYRELGVGVKYFDTNTVDGDDFPSKKYSNVNLIFLDLFYNGTFDAELCVNWIRDSLHINSFYILVLWTKDPSHKVEIEVELKKHNIIPFKLLCENKISYFQSQGVYNWQNLKTKIDTELESMEEINELRVWKNRVLETSNKIVGYLTKEIDEIELRKKLQKIIIGHGGTYLQNKEVKSDDGAVVNTINVEKFEEKRQVLLEALDLIMVSNSKSVVIDEKFSQKIKAELYNIKSNLSSEVDRKLNSWFHFKLFNSSELNSFLSSGLIAYMNNDFLKRNYSLLEDPEVSKFLEKQKKHNEKIKNLKAYIDLSKVLTEKDKAEKELKELGDEVIIKDIAIIISRPCDIAQSKFGRNLKLLSGLHIINGHRKKGKFESNSKPLSLKMYEHLSVNDDDDSIFIFDFRYSFSLSPDIFKGYFEVVKLFNKEILSDLQVEYGSYVNRLGITQIV